MSTSGVITVVCWTGLIGGLAVGAFWPEIRKARDNVRDVLRQAGKRPRAVPPRPAQVFDWSARGGFTMRDQERELEALPTVEPERRWLA